MCENRDRAIRCDRDPQIRCERIRVHFGRVGKFRGVSRTKATHQQERAGGNARQETATCDRIQDRRIEGRRWGRPDFRLQTIPLDQFAKREFRCWLVHLRKSFPADRKSTRLNSSHMSISYAAFCLKKKISENDQQRETQSGRRAQEYPKEVARF